MRRFFAIVLFVTLCVAGSDAQAQSPHRILGTWQMDVEGSSFDPATGEREEHSALSFMEGPDGFLIYTHSLITSQGNPGFTQSAFRFDGRDYPIYAIGTLGTFLATGTESIARGIFDPVDANTIELVVTVRGQPAALSRTFTVATDGQTLAYRIRGTDGDQPINNVLVFDRVQ